jgi:hypothetical protein
MGMDICSLEKEMGDISTTVLAIYERRPGFFTLHHSYLYN